LAFEVQDALLEEDDRISIRIDGECLLAGRWHRHSGDHEMLEVAAKAEDASKGRLKGVDAVALTLLTSRCTVNGMAHGGDVVPSISTP
jgi:hypothetical protein